MRQLPYGLGLIIPSLIIGITGYGLIFHILPQGDPAEMYLWCGGYAMVWVSYIVAIFKDPGRISKSLATDLEFSVWCDKCDAPKPERAHHCSQCKRCVLKMDHHCPWTRNCVGNDNLPHFIRFLGWVVAMEIFSLYETLKFDLGVWQNPDMPAYLYSTATLVFGLVLVPVEVVVLLSVALLMLRVISNLVQGKSQIEDWEIDRANRLAYKKIAPRVDFPFDIDPSTNILTGMGPIWGWILPWSGPGTDGYHFEKLFKTKARWPPQTPIARAHDFYRVDHWMSPEGETVADFGVDPETERAEPQVHHDPGAAHGSEDDDENETLSSIRSRQIAASQQ